MHIDFNNTAFAFASRSNIGILKAYWMFRIVANNKLVRIGHWLTHLALKTGLPISWLFRDTVFSHFCGGEDIKDCEKAIQSLSHYGIGTILDYAAEGMSSEKEFEETASEIMRTIDQASTSEAIPFAVFKVTGVARFALLEKAQASNNLTMEEVEELQRVKERIGHMCKKAFELKVRLFIDAEESWIQDVIDDIVLENMRLYNKKDFIVYNTLQMYRTDRIDYFNKLLHMAETEDFKIGLKLVRGAYMEKERERAITMGYDSPIQPDKEATDACFDEGVSLCIKHIERVAVCVATHNENSMYKLIQLLKDTNLPANHPDIYSAQLLGMSDNISFNLSAAGYNVAKYVPYGKVRTVIPYLLRRATENTSVGGQTSRELKLIKEEMHRRRILRKGKV